MAVMNKSAVHLSSSSSGGTHSVLLRTRLGELPSYVINVAFVNTLTSVRSRACPSEAWLWLQVTG